jgi:glycosyltransferase involved in cell wall biosynthesis
VIRIVIDTKNLALYGGGIAHWFAPLLAAWVKHRPDMHFQLLGPDFCQDFLPHSGNWTHVPLAWPLWLPRPLRHPWYDNVLFPRAVARLNPNLVMSPYHDVRMPRGIPSVIGVHDLCLDELETVYPRRIRLYYLTLLRGNLKRASHVITVSETSRAKLTERYGVLPQHISVIYNGSTPYFGQATDVDRVAEFKMRFLLRDRFVLYTGGSEFRKNIERLAESFAQLAKTDTGLNFLVTGDVDKRWRDGLAKIPSPASSRVVFSGKLSDEDLRLAYAAADAVVYPSLCEGFGRVCLEAMEAGAPLACSDLPVMHEVAGTYACYFDPYDSDAIARVMSDVLAKGRQVPAIDERFSLEKIRLIFTKKMDGLVEELVGNTEDLP